MSDDFAAKLAELRDAYIASLPKKLDDIQSVLSRQSLDEMHDYAHRLRGTAGSYGLASVSEAAGAIEDRIEKIEPDDQSSPAFWSELAELLAAARVAVKELK